MKITSANYLSLFVKMHRIKKTVLIFYIIFIGCVKGIDETASVFFITNLRNETLNAIVKYQNAMVDTILAIGPKENRYITKINKIIGNNARPEDVFKEINAYEAGFDTIVYEQKIIKNDLWSHEDLKDGLTKYFIEIK